MGHVRAADPSRPPPNRLAGETSPYLLQHAHNPVDWYPWGPEAFEAARTRGVPIFLSVGYSTCYWCHVMERESFEDPATGKLMSELFICIKVDREERPDVDDIYMQAVQLMTRRGGWPMSVWLTPPSDPGAAGHDEGGLRPFYAGTYFPAEPRHGMPSFPEVLRNISEAWMTQREAVLEQAANVTAAIREQLAARADPVAIGPDQVSQAAAILLRMHDATHGGFGNAPKFPQPVFLEFLMDVATNIEDPAVSASARRAIRLTLDKMALGGMYDHVGGGFHRYSVDEKWLVPHFEKMLYDNGQLAALYARSTRESGDSFDAEIVRETVEYVLREMTDERSGFWSAQDAEVNHREGQNYLWTRSQIEEVLGAEDGAFAARAYGVDAGPNFRDPHHPGDSPANVLFLHARPEEIAREVRIDAAALGGRLASVNTKLYEARQRRDQPGTDDKVITSWNGLMIAGLAEGAAALREPKYLEAGRRAAAFVIGSAAENTADTEGRPDQAYRGLLRASRAGRARTPGFLEDYAMLMHGLIALHRAGLTLGSPDPSHLRDAAALWESSRARFEDPSRPGILFDTEPGQRDLIVRTRGTYDGALPSGSSVMLHNLIDMYELTGERAWLERAADVLAGLSAAIKESPVGSINATRGLFRLLRLDAALVAERCGAASDVQGGVVHLKEAPVQIFASVDRITVPPMGAAPAELTLELRIAEGFHITARDPGAGIEGLVPLSIEIRGGTGPSLRVEYPASEVYQGAMLPPEDAGKLRVHSGAVRIKVLIERAPPPAEGAQSGGWSGRPMLTLTYQPCTDEACFQPVTVELDVALDGE